MVVPCANNHWFPGEGLGGSRKGIADPIMAGNVKKNNLGVGAQEPGEVSAEDDIYEQYKKRMMLGYRYRPNPLVNNDVYNVFFFLKSCWSFDDFHGFLVLISLVFLFLQNNPRKAYY